MVHSLPLFQVGSALRCSFGASDRAKIGDASVMRTLGAPVPSDSFTVTEEGRSANGDAVEDAGDAEMLLP